jgi:hypothetical protein
VLSAVRRVARFSFETGRVLGEQLAEEALVGPPHGDTAA